VRVTAVETLRLDEHPEIIWVRIETDEGQTGLGETMPRVGPVERVIHEALAPLLVGEDVAPESFWERAFRSLAYHGYAGAEMRAVSAVDCALWDALGQAAGLPVHRLLGGPCRASVPVYNTCVTYGDHRDRERFLSDAGSLARELADEGFPAMKIWPFDEHSIESRGARLDSAGLEAGASAFESIRDAAGGRIDVALEGHSCWSVPAAIAIARRLEGFAPTTMWLEDMLHAAEPSAWVELRRASAIPICGSERLFARYQVAPFLEAGAFDVVKQDLLWTGGFTEFVKIAAMCDARELPVALHNCHGPVGAMATVHASAAIPNLFLMESIRSFARGFFAVLADGAPVVERGAIAVPERPGLGVTLRPEVVERARRVRSDARGMKPYGWGDGDPWAGDLGDRV
jgi:L-alanine-DL-glutamate epimerase-like enolase superfamily enzyme